MGDRLVDSRCIKMDVIIVIYAALSVSGNYSDEIWYIISGEDGPPFVNVLVVLQEPSFGFPVISVKWKTFLV